MLFMVSVSHAREQIKVITSFTQTADGLILLRSFFDNINNNQTKVKYVVQALPGANGLNAYRQFQNEKDSLLFTQHTMFIENKIDHTNHLLYALYQSNHEVLVNRNSNIKTVDDLIALHKQRNIFHGRVSSGATSQISLSIFMNDYNLDSKRIVNITAYARAEELLFSLLTSEIDFIIRAKTSIFGNENIASILTLDFGPIWIFAQNKSNLSKKFNINQIKKSCYDEVLVNNNIFILNKFTSLCLENDAVDKMIGKDIEIINKFLN